MRKNDLSSVSPWMHWDHLLRDVNWNHLSVPKVIPLGGVTVSQNSRASECEGSKLAARLSGRCHRCFNPIETFYGGIPRLCKHWNTVRESAVSTFIICHQLWPQLCPNSWNLLKPVWRGCFIPTCSGIWEEFDSKVLASLSKLAKKYLAMDATSVPAERILFKSRAVSESDEVH